MAIKVIHQTFYTSQGIRESWAVIVNNRPSFIFYTEGEIKAFLRGLNG